MRGCEPSQTCRMKSGNDSHNQLTGQLSVCSYQGNLARDPSVFVFLKMEDDGTTRHTHPATLIQPVIQDSIGTHLGQDTIHMLKNGGNSSILFGVDCSYRLNSCYTAWLM